MNQEKMLRKENNAKDKLLAKEDARILTDMVVYLHSGNLCEYDIEIMRKELIGMALEAEARNDSFKNSIGEDYKAFCDLLMKNGRKKTKYEKGLEISRIMVFGIGFLFVYEILISKISFGLKFGFNNWSFEMPVTWGFVLSTLCCVIAAYFIFYMISKNSFAMNLPKYKILFGILFAVCFVSIVIIKITMSKMILFNINFIYPLLLIVFLSVLITMLETRYINDLAKTHK